MTARPLIVGNWKMQVSLRTATDVARAIAAAVPRLSDRDVAIAPPFPALPAVAAVLAGSGVRLGAQDLFWEDDGAYTGEVSGPMLKEIGVTYVIVGHSERRIVLGETDRMVALKTTAAARSGLRPILCVGERQEDRLSGRHETVACDMLRRSLEGVPAEASQHLAVGYEPVWAIGSGCAASTSEIASMHACLRRALREHFGSEDGHRILYGGSVTERNIDELMSQPGVDGVLVGGASLQAEAFARIVDFRSPKSRTLP
jgi:triosephosphate isomerase